MVNLDALLALEEKATRKEWVAVDGGIGFMLDGIQVYVIRDKLLLADNCNLELIAAMRNNFKDLCLRLKAAEENNLNLLDEVRAAHETLEGDECNCDFCNSEEA